jgi:hypothetical protein
MMRESHEAVLENAGFLCGLIRDKEDSMLGDLRFIDDLTLSNLREERMMRMMIMEVGSLGHEGGCRKECAR